MIPLGQLKPDIHTFQVVIDQEDNEGTSFNHWSVTGVLTGQLIDVENNQLSVAVSIFFTYWW